MKARHTRPNRKRLGRGLTPEEIREWDRRISEARKRKRGTA